MNKFCRYLLIGIVFWVIVDYTGAFNPDFDRWIRHMPLIWIFYIGYPAIFAFLFYNRNWRGWKMLAATLFSALLLEIVVFSNAFLYTFPILLIMIPIAFAIYGFITYVPFWIVEGTLAKNWQWVVLFVIVWLMISILNYQSSITGV